jgi:TolB-like protein/predicted Ser/Thr protein kinase/Tfp pilus assembly protein PilF
MTNTRRVCPKCGATVFADAPQGCCSVCLVRTGLASLDNEDDEASEPTIARMLKDFGDYELLQEIGRGGQGVVYRARQKSLNRIVALKLIGLAHWATEAHVKRFRMEAEAAAHLDDPHIIPIYEIGERDGACYYSMKFIEGSQLDKVIGSELMPLRKAAELMAKLARTLDYAHQHGVLHRDVKPGNILLDAKGEPHLTDFGLARLVETESTVTRTLEVLGTPSYMAPEQAVGNNARVASATDVYGLGAVLYQLLTGHPPFAGGTTFETVRLVLDTEPRQPRLWNPKVDRDLATICLKCLEKDPPRRYSSALALAEDLERWLKHEPIRARRTGMFARGRKWVRRNPTSALLAASLVALAAAIGAMIWKSEFVHRPPTTGIAVLPFKNLSDDKENAFFADGIQDDILTKLAKVAGLKVISRISVMPYRGARNTRQIGDALGISHVLEGSVQRAGGKVRVNAQLIDTRTDTHIWSEQYERDLTDVFVIQTEIAQQIANQLQTKLSPAESAAIAERPTADLAAYAFYTKAKEIFVWNDWEGAEKSLTRQVELLEKATQRDPTFALAYCALAKAQCDLGTHLESKKAADAALQLRPDLGEGHRELARYYFSVHNFDRAYDELTVARRTLPNDSEVLRIAADTDRHQNRWADALANFQKASELDPRNYEVAWHLGRTYFEMRRYYELEQLLTKQAAGGALEDFWIQRLLAEIKLAQGDPVAAQSLLEKVPLDFSPTPEIWETRFMATLYLRDYDAANRVIAAMPAKWADLALFGQLWMRLVKTDAFPPESCADGLIARARGDKQKALAVFAAARKKVDATWSDKDERYFSLVAELDAGLGRKEEAIREALRAVELMPIAKDSVVGPDIVTNLALVYAWTGERDRALEQLEVVAKIPAGPTYGDLRFNPCWDPLRGDARFDKIVAAAKSASR